jgi:membrane-associated phospholipid phosphatase
MTPVAPSWPDRARWLAFLKFMAMFYALFLPFYFGAGHIAAGTSETFGLYWPWERNIPLVPWMIWPYLTLFSLFLLPLFHMSANQIAALSRQSSATLVFAGAVFVLVPTHSGFAPIAGEGMHRPLFALLAIVDTRHNLVPSLHVAFSALILFGCAAHARTLWAWSYRLWLLVMSASTVLVHQHHIFDVVSGLTLALLMRRVFPLARAGASIPP